MDSGQRVNGGARGDRIGHWHATWAWRDRRVPHAVLVVLLVTDAGLVLVHLVQDYLDVQRLAPFALGLGVPEAYGYLKLLWSTMLLWTLARRLRDPFAVVLSGVTGFLLLDDALRFHEVAGHALADDVTRFTVAGLRPTDVGELLFEGAVGLVMLLVIAIGWRLASSAGRTVGLGVFASLALLVVAGVGVDLVHVEGPWRPLVEVLEDGTELVALSLLLAHVVGWLDLLREPTDRS